MKTIWILPMFKCDFEWTKRDLNEFCIAQSESIGNDFHAVNVRVVYTQKGTTIQYHWWDAWLVECLYIFFCCFCCYSQRQLLQKQCYQLLKEYTHTHTEISQIFYYHFINFSVTPSFFSSSSNESLLFSDNLNYKLEHMFRIFFLWHWNVIMVDDGFVHDQWFEIIWVIDSAYVLIHF